MDMRPIAHIKNDLKTKFGIPRQAGLVDSLESEIVFCPEFRNPDALRGLEDFSHIWLIWDFSMNHREDWSATVRPPRLGGNVRKGVFATRSPFRPNPIGLSVVRLGNIDFKSCSIKVYGADLMDGTPIYDIKPYMPWSDALPHASAAYAPRPDASLSVIISPEDEKKLSPSRLNQLKQLLALDPRPAYQEDPERIYGFVFADFEVRFRVKNGELFVTSISPLSS